MVGTAVAAAVVGRSARGRSVDFRTGLFVLLLAPEVYVPLRLAGQRYHAAEDGAAAATALLELLDARGPARTGPAGGDPAREPIVVRGVTVAGGAGRPRSLGGSTSPSLPAASPGWSGLRRGQVDAARAAGGAARAGRGTIDVRRTRRLGGEAWWPRVAWLGKRPALLRGPLRGH